MEIWTDINFIHKTFVSPWRTIYCYWSHTVHTNGHFADSKIIQLEYEIEDESIFVRSKFIISLLAYNINVIVTAGVKIKYFIRRWETSEGRRILFVTIRQLYNLLVTHALDGLGCNISVWVVGNPYVLSEGWLRHFNVGTFNFH